MGPDDNNVMKKYIQKKIETCPTSECDHGVETKYEFKVEDPTADTESKDIAKPKNDQSNDENYEENLFSEALLNAKTNKDGSICTSAGCSESSEEHDKMNSLADGILDSLKQLQDKLESSVVNLLDEIRDKHKDINHPKAKQEFEKIRQFLNNEQNMQIKAAQVLHSGDNEQQNTIQNAKDELKEPIIIEKNKENEKKVYKDEQAETNAGDPLVSEKQITITEDTNSGTESINGNVTDNETKLNNAKNVSNKEKSNSKHDSHIEDDVDPNTRTREDL